jgi:lipopolysaccharide export system protein LptA
MRRLAFLLGLAAAAGLTWAVCVAQQHALRGNVADIFADEMEVDYANNTATLAGGVRVQIKGSYDATMTAPRVTAVTSEDTNQLVALEASGPVTLDVTSTTSEGKQLRVSARCSQVATFSEKTMIAVLKGNAHAEVTKLPRLEGVESAKYDGETLTVDLKAHTIKLGGGVHLNVEMAPEQPKPEAGAKQ